LLETFPQVQNINRTNVSIIIVIKESKGHPHELVCFDNVSVAYLFDRIKEAIDVNSSPLFLLASFVF